MAVIVKWDAPPDKNFPGAVGQICVDGNTGIHYECVEATKQQGYKLSVGHYNWVRRRLSSDFVVTNTGLKNALTNQEQVIVKSNKEGDPKRYGRSWSQTSQATALYAPYVAFMSMDPFTLSVTNPGWNGIMETSTDEIAWTEWDGCAVDAVLLNGGQLGIDGLGDVYGLMVRGMNNTVVTGPGAESGPVGQWTITPAGSECVYFTGDIENLLDYRTVEYGVHPQMGDYCFCAMFYGSRALKLQSNWRLYLPATTLSKGCYMHMFNGCTSLTETPELPATTLKTQCYQQMFYGCTSLVEAPALPATTLANSCYTAMFANCTSLTTAPALPATKLANNCYQAMLQNTAITEPPELPATELKDYCYAMMFYGCASLTKAPELLAMELAEYCYYAMFYKCKALGMAQDCLPATTLAVNCYYQMFNGTALTTAPALPATTLTEGCYSFMFHTCASLTEAPELPATNLAPECYHGMLDSCSKLATAPVLPATELTYACYTRLFRCTGLTETPELPATIATPYCYYRMFEGCTSLTEAPELPATTVDEACYCQMFHNCTSLTTAPELPATTLAEGCYNDMFNGCTKIKLATEAGDDYPNEYRIPTSGDGTIADGALGNMFAYTGGTFTGTPEINTVYYTANAIV